MFGLSMVDITVIVLYFVVILAIGAWSARRIKNQEDFFLGGRNFGKLIQTFAAFGQGTSADNAVGVTTTTFTNGASGMWSSLLYLFATPMYWLVMPWLRRLRVLTTGDFFQERYGSRSMAAVYAILGSIGMMGFIAVGFTAMTKTIVAITPKAFDEYTESDQVEYELAYHGQLLKLGDEASRQEVLSFDELIDREQLRALSPETLDEAAKARLASLEEKRPARVIAHWKENVLIWLVCLVVMLYAVAGGLEAAFLTDMLQGMFIILLSVILIPFAWAKINVVFGGSTTMDALHTIHRQLPESFFEILGSPYSIDFTWYYILAISLMSLFNVVIQPNALVANGSAKDEYTARYGFTVGSFMKRFCTVLWGIFGLAAVVLYSSEVNHSDLVWGYATRDLLGPLNLGLVGLMIACLMAALMSTADCLMLTCSSLLTHNLYRPLMADRSEHHYVWAGRVFGALVLVGSVLLATAFDTILQLLKFVWEFPVMLAPAFWLGMKWRRANVSGAWACILAGGVFFFLLPSVLPMVAPQLRTNPYLLKTTDPAPLVCVYTAGQADVNARQVEIEAWDNRHAHGQTKGPRPELLSIGQEFQKTYPLPKKSIFWSKDLQPDAEERLAGSGTLSLELVLLDYLGCDLSRNPHALNQTVRILIRVAVPFLIMLGFSLLFPPDNRSMVNRFFARMRTKVRRDRDEDLRELALSYENVHRHDDLLLFPNSQWEFYRWDREAAVGFFLAVLTVGGLLLTMTVLVSLGA